MVDSAVFTFQIHMLHALARPGRKWGNATKTPVNFLDVFCDSLMKIKTECFMAKLSQCYEGHALNTHAAYLLENLKVTSALVALHLDSRAGTNTSIVDCPVFKDDELYADDADSISVPGKSSSGGSGVNAGLVVTVVILALVIVAGVSLVLVKHYRLVPRLKAVVTRVPYADFVMDDHSQSQQQQPGNELQVQEQEEPPPRV
jgi:hypothetical protein